jgi:hypothetical protein
VKAESKFARLVVIGASPNRREGKLGAAQHPHEIFGNSLLAKNALGTQGITLEVNVFSSEVDLHRGEIDGEAVLEVPILVEPVDELGNQLLGCLGVNDFLRSHVQHVRRG